MTIKILAFGQISDILSGAEIELDNIDNTEKLTVELNQKFPELIRLKYAVAVNGELVSGRAILKHQDSVALLPPFSGG